MHTSIVSSQPDASLMIFIDREYRRMHQATGKKVVGIDLETVVIRVILIKPGERPDPQVPEIIFHDASHLVAGYIIRFLRVIAVPFEMPRRLSFIKPVHTSRDPEICVGIFKKGVDIFVRNDTGGKRVSLLHI